MLFNKIALLLVIVGAFNWGLIGLFGLDAVAWLFGGQASLISRIIYTIIGVAGVWCVTMLFSEPAEGYSHR
ncbi:MAG: DUF378 domain-containing protein [Oscillospiraceae bacterium]|nr:DUF378 domain-containing protein [Oscillospiraceae bacterium]MBQ4539305.1 DUF378 domain-containing protein [Oscillospiraceae bacterium]